MASGCRTLCPVLMCTCSRGEGLLSLVAQRFDFGDAKHSDWHWLDIAPLQIGVSRLR